MITVSEARKLISENYPPGKVELMQLIDACGFVLAEETYAAIDTPPFNQSAMDGYAFSFTEWDGNSNLKLIGEIQAGNFSYNQLKPFEVVRIYTGSALPMNADTVVMQEKVIKHVDVITIKDEHLVKGSNVRLQGSQGRKGEITLPKGHYLTPAAISFLAGTGIDKVKIYAKPSVGIIVTGKELVQPGEPIPEGKIYESNSFGLIAALNQLNISPLSLEVVDDFEEDIVQAIARQLQNDILIVTGGVSVGDYDFVSSALGKCGVKKIFHKVKQKPGKPFYFGRYEQTLVFALPGNPAAVMSCFYEYVVPAISNFTKKNYFKKLQLPLAKDFMKKPGLTFFLKGKSEEDKVFVLENQESYLMNSFAMADCIVELEEVMETFKQGDLVNVSMIV